MIDLSMTFEESMKKIDFRKFIYNFNFRNNGLYFGKEGISLGINSDDFKHVGDFLEKKYGFSSRGFGDFALEALFNGFEHGNNYDLSSPLYFSVLGGRKGFIARVEDSGNGFDYNKIINKYNLKEIHSSTFDSSRGKGFGVFDRSEAIINWEGKGNTINMFYLAK